MLFRRLVLLALVSAAIVGTIHWALIQWQAVPIIAAAERFEHHRAANHAQAAWEPEEGFERSAATWLASVLLQFSLALALLAAMAWLSRRSPPVPDPLRGGVLLGLAGFCCLFAWPSLGLPPEIPGLDAARLGSRQGWWALAAGSALLAVGIAGLGRGRARWLLAAAFLALPHLVGAPHVSGDPFAGFDADAASRLRELETRFLWVSAFISATQWLLLGITCGFLARRWLRDSWGHKAT